jgi:hypothetical protein
VLFPKYHNDHVKEDEMDRTQSMHGEKRHACSTSVGESERKMPVEKPTGRLEDNIKMNLRLSSYGLA